MYIVLRSFRGELPVNPDLLGITILFPCLQHGVEVFQVVGAFPANALHAQGAQELSYY